MSAKKVRQSIVDSVKNELMGPINGPEEEIDRVPSEQYLTGVIYPTLIDEEPAEIDEENEVSDEEEETHSNLQPPRSLGISCVIDRETDKVNLEVQVAGAKYKEISSELWKRVSISSNKTLLSIRGKDLGIIFSDKKESGKTNLSSYKESTLEQKDKIMIAWETSPLVNDRTSSHLSIFLINEAESVKRKKAASSLYQCYLSLSTGESYSILSRPQKSYNTDDDLKSLNLLYSNQKEFGVGHSVSINWDAAFYSDTYIVGNGDNLYSNLGKNNIDPKSNDRCKFIETTFFPQYNSRSLEFALSADGDNPDLNMYNFSDLNYLKGKESNRNRNIKELRKLSSGYKSWIGKTFSKDNTKKLEEHKETISRHEDTSYQSLKRIDEGITLLEENELAYQAFCLMNRAIWLQFINKKEAQNNKDEESYFLDSDDTKWVNAASWRPFQLGFILQNLSSVFDKNHPDRGIVDLLWVRTGGGKTEAYLGLLSFVMFLSRVRKDEDKIGCEVMMRYTLRLLTLQQFQRATRLIMACEIIRLVDKFNILGDCKPFSIGLYIGQAGTPNKVKGTTSVKNDYVEYQKERSIYNKSLTLTAEYALTYWEKEKKLPSASNPVQILNCPWCGTELRPKDHKIEEVASSHNFVVHCGNSICDFHRNPIPYQTVDDALYREPPSLLVGTVDKFAQITFNLEMGRLFGWTGGERSHNPPSLIIQDELHLINGPLGSLVGLYEATIDYLCTDSVTVALNDSKPLHEITPTDFDIQHTGKAKIVASTATIRNADRQCNALYDRETFRFPPSGIDIDDSYFVRTRNDTMKDKAYVGLLCGGIGSKTMIKSVSTNILKKVSAHKLDGAPLDHYDPYWTIISYYNSMRELGGSVTLLRDDIRTNVQNHRKSILDENSIGELHGGLNSTELPQVLERLQKKATESKPYDVVTCTNMFSVGVDVDRLGLMLINSQPKATTEYLQSTGRVGRGLDGLVFVLFNQARPRDQSHFETFYDYHSRVQLHVESMTVTPYSEGTLDRGLHAQYVAYLRQAFKDFQHPIREEEMCIDYSTDIKNDEKSIAYCVYLLKRALNISGSNQVFTTLRTILNEFQEKWIRRAKFAKSTPTFKDSKDRLKSKLRYRGQSFGTGGLVPRLLEQDPSSPWIDRNKVKNDPRNFKFPSILTPSSLRNVEEEVDLVHLRRKKNG